MTVDPVDVTVFSTPFCAPCEALKRHLERKGIAFKVRDLMMDEEAQDLLEAHNIRSTPALGIGDALYAGEALAPQNLGDLLAPLQS